MVIPVILIAMMSLPEIRGNILLTMTGVDRILAMVEDMRQREANSRKDHFHLIGHLLRIIKTIRKISDFFFKVGNACNKQLSSHYLFPALNIKKVKLPRVESELFSLFIFQAAFI